MKSMQLQKVAAISLLLAFAGAAIAPSVLAEPINPNLSWAPNPITTGSTTTATFGVADTLPTGGSDNDCPSGDFFSGTLTVTTPGGLTSTYTVTSVPCGTQNLSAIYPTAFTPGTGAPSTATAGVYGAVWAGTTTATVGGVHPTFNTSDNFVVTTPVTGVPQFGASAMLVAAIGLIAMAALKRSKVISI
jgi:hypothetical protein